MARFTWLMPNVDKDLEKKAMNTLETMGNDVKSLSQQRCPVDTGTLRNSAMVARDDGAKKVQVGYGGAAASYSIRQHEDTSLHHNAPGQAKFLESAATEVIDKFKKGQYKINI
jgi:hypothetical protein